MSQVTIYTTPWCPYCHRAKAHLKKLGLDFAEIDVDGDRHARAALAERTGQRTVPQVFFGDHSIGGNSDLEQLIRADAWRTAFNAHKDEPHTNLKTKG